MIYPLLWRYLITIQVAIRLLTTLFRHYEVLYFSIHLFLNLYLLFMLLNLFLYFSLLLLLLYIFNFLFHFHLSSYYWSMEWPYTHSSYFDHIGRLHVPSTYCTYLLLKRIVNLSTELRILIQVRNMRFWNIYFHSIFLFLLLFMLFLCLLSSLPISQCLIHILLLILCLL